MAAWGYLHLSTNHQKIENRRATMIKAVGGGSCMEGVTFAATYRFFWSAPEAMIFSDEELRRLLDYLDRPWNGFRKVRKRVKKRGRRHMQSLGCTAIDEYR